MKKKFAIITTWNGEEYSYSNALIEEFETSLLSIAKVRCYKLMKKLELKHLKSDDYELTDFESGFGWTVLKSDNSGSYQAFEITDDLYGFVINVNVNEVMPCTKEEFEEYKAYAIKHACLDLLEEEDLDSDSFIITTESGEYDQQFIKL